MRHGADDALAALTADELVVDHLATAADRTLVTGTLRSAGAELPFAHVWEADGDTFARVTTYFDRSRPAVVATRQQLAEAADELLEQTAEIRRQWDRLGDALRAAGLEADAPGAGPAAWAGGSARLVAVDMAQEGSTREDVEAFLRDELGVDDVDPILDEVFAADGPAQPADASEAAEAAEAHRVARLFARNRD